MVRICIISSADISEPYGSTTRPYFISKYLAEFGCEILHVCLSVPESNQESRIRFLQKKYYKSRFWLFRTARDLLRVFKECKKFSPDVIYLHQLSNATRGLPLKYLTKNPVVYDAHGSSVLEYADCGKINHKIISLQEKIILEKSDRVIVVSEELKDFFLEHFNISFEKLELIQNGVDTNTLKPIKPDPKIKKDLGISPEDKVVVFTCPRDFLPNLMALKYFFEIVPKIESSFGRIKFLIIGGGPEIEPPSPSVIYTGFVEDLNSYINLGDVCVAPYPPAAVCGGTRNKVADYFACGKPVISTEEGMRGFKDAKPNRDFLLAEDESDFINEMLKVLYDARVAKKLGVNARRLALKYDWTMLSGNVLNLMKKL